MVCYSLFCYIRFCKSLKCLVKIKGVHILVGLILLFSCRVYLGLTEGAQIFNKYIKIYSIFILLPEAFRGSIYSPGCPSVCPSVRPYEFVSGP